MTSRRLRQLNEDTLIDRHITWAEDERTAWAKVDPTSKHKQAINHAHKTGITKAHTSFPQKSRNTGYALSTYFASPWVHFNNQSQVRHYNPTSHVPMITYDSGADGHYVCEADHLQAGLPILRPSTKQVGVANGSISTASHVCQLPFPQLSATATEANSSKTSHILS